MNLKYTTTTTTIYICMTIQTHTVLQKLCLGIKITTQGNYVSVGNSMICSDIWHKYHE